MPMPDAPPLEPWLDQRWYEAQPIILRGWVPEFSEAETVAETGADSSGLTPGPQNIQDRGHCANAFATLADNKGLRTYLTQRAAVLGTTFAPGSNMHLFDEARDREGIRIVQDHDLWVKLSRLSTRETDASLRVRHGFGKEGPDDLSRDLERHRMVAELAQTLWPAMGALPTADAWSKRLERWIEGPVLRTQTIAYFNAPDGGALWHHDAFDEPLIGGQRGVLYVQHTGRTAWLACSIDALTHLFIEFLEYLEEGEMPWVREDLLGKRDREMWPKIYKRTERFVRLRKELTKPGQGVYGPWVGRPEFSALAADAGHAFLLDPGDAILLPNHGYEKTAMHSVFCASPGPTLAFSMALREDREGPGAPAQEFDRNRPRRRRRRGRGRR